MKKWTPKQIIILLYLAVVPMYLILLFVLKLLHIPINDGESNKEVLIFILGGVSTLLTHKVLEE